MLKKYLYFFIKKSSERQHRAYYRDYYRAEYAEFERCADKKSPARIRREMRCLQRYWKTYPFQYIRYRLYGKGLSAFDEQMKAYIPDYFAYFLFYPQSFNERNVLCEDKRLLRRCAGGMGSTIPGCCYPSAMGYCSTEGKIPARLNGCWPGFRLPVWAGCSSNRLSVWAARELKCLICVKGGICARRTGAFWMRRM